MDRTHEHRPCRRSCSSSPSTEEQPQGDDQLVVVQANVKQCLNRLKGLVAHLSSSSRPCDVIAIQDPPKSVAWFRPKDYTLWHCSDTELREEHDPRLPENAPNGPNASKTPDFGKVCFLVHKTIPLSHWSAVSHPSLSPEHRLAATLTLLTSCGHIAIHNVYNLNQTINIEQLVDTTTATASDLIVGDFNLHHEHWGGDRVRGEQLLSDAKALYEGLVVGADMRCLTEKGAITYSRSISSEKYCSTIDLTFLSERLFPRLCHNFILDIPGFKSDHRPIETSLNMRPGREPRVSRRWKRVRKKEFIKAVKKHTACLADICLETETQVDQFLSAIADALQLATERYVALSVIVEQPGARSKQASQAEDDKRAPPAEGDKQSFYHFIQEKTQFTRGAFQIAKEAVKWCKPCDQAHMSDLITTEGVFRTPQEKAQCLRGSLWREENVSDGETAPPLARPDLKPGRHQHLAPQSLEVGELSGYIRALPNRKAVGPDQIPNEALKLSRDVITPLLERAFNACLRLVYHPVVFREAATIMLRKPEKNTYAAPKSWRPVALLSNIGKLLEKVITTRLSGLAGQHSLIANVQFGTPGRCTTTAVRVLLNPIYKAWTTQSSKKRATLLSLDIAGAFDRVDRAKLLNRLVEKGIPDWIVLFVWSFLSDRGTILVMVGDSSDHFWVNIGIPQGSPLSPILFLFFASPILELFADSTEANLLAIAYIDDTYLMVVSPSYQRNCEALAHYHEKLMGWALPNGVEFAPHKYALMHFRDPENRRDYRCQLVPPIPGLEKLKPETEMRILGVTVDPDLKWDRHINNIKTKVAQQMKYLKRICKAHGGARLRTMRRLYLSKIRPIISYGCGAWFLDKDMVRGNLPFRLNKTCIEKLESIQYKCLVQISGAMEKTSRAMLQKELCIDSIQVFLGCQARAFHARSMLHPDYADMARRRKKIAAWDPKAKRHPYELLDEVAGELLALADRKVEALEKGKNRGQPDSFGGVVVGDSETAMGMPPGEMTDEESAGVAFAVAKHRRDERKKQIGKCALELAEEKSAKLWDDCRRQRAQRPGPVLPVLEEAWGKTILDIYTGLTRAQSTMLLRIRTGVIGLNAYLFSINSPNKPLSSPLCSCGVGPHTARHLFLECPQLRLERWKLRNMAGHLDLQILMTKDAGIAADWAISYFDIESFASVKSRSRFEQPPPIQVGSS